MLIYRSLGNSLKYLDVIELFNFFIFNGISDVDYIGLYDVIDDEGEVGFVVERRSVITFFLL